MSSSSDPTKLTTTVISKFDGMNYKVWADALRSFLWYQGLWFLIQSYGSTAQQALPGMACPTLSTTPTPEEITAQAAWNEKNDKALSSI